MIHARMHFYVMWRTDHRVQSLSHCWDCVIFDQHRQDEEMKTESRIVEKLEQSRMEDEKKRASVLFGDKFDNLQNAPAAQTAPQMAPAPQPVKL